LSATLRVVGAVGMGSHRAAVRFHDSLLLGIGRRNEESV
jgi:hypothetical protein